MPGTPGSTSTVLGISFDAHDAARVATSWAAVLGRRVAEGASTAHAVVLPDDVVSTGPRLAFHQVPEGKTAKNRMHLDLVTTDVGAETRRLAGLGARKLGSTTNGAHWVTFADPEGNEFDVIAAPVPA